MESPSFARSHTGAKRTSKVEARVTDELKFDLQRLCHELGMTESDFVDRLLNVRLYGIDHVRSVEQRRLEMVCGVAEQVRTQTC